MSNEPPVNLWDNKEIKINPWIGSKEKEDRVATTAARSRDINKVLPDVNRFHLAAAETFLPGAIWIGKKFGLGLEEFLFDEISFRPSSGIRPTDRRNLFFRFLNEIFDWELKKYLLDWTTIILYLSDRLIGGNETIDNYL